MTKKKLPVRPPYDIWDPIRDGPVQIQVDEGRGVFWVNSGKDGRCLIRVCQIPNLPDMLNRRTGPWMIDVISAKDDSQCYLCGHKFVSPYPPGSRADAGKFKFAGHAICGDCGDALKER